MKKNLLLTAAILGFFVTQAQASNAAPTYPYHFTPVLTFDGEYNHDDDVDYFDFKVNSAPSAQNQLAIWTDTLQDGLDINGYLFRKNPATGAYDFVTEVLNATQNSSFTIANGKNSTGVNDFGVANKNGFEPYVDVNNQGALGVSDPGRVFPDTNQGGDAITPGEYRFAVMGFLDIPTAFFNGGGTLAEGIMDLNSFFGANDPELEWSTWQYNTGKGAPHHYEVYIAGDVSAVSAVPVPAAAWLFVSAVSGLGIFARRKVRL